MKIAVNCRFLIEGRLEGIGVFTREVVDRLIEWYPEHSFILFFDRKPPEHYKEKSNVQTIVLPPQARHPLLWYLWFEFSVPGKLYSLKPDVFLSMDGFLTLRPIVPRLPVIHDIAFEHYPADVPLLARWYYRFFFPRFARAADRIATVSSYTADDLVKTYGVDKSKIDIVYNGAGSRFLPLEAGKIREIREELTGGVPYFIYVGALHQRKNIARLLAAFDIFKKSTDVPFKLVLAGRKAWKTREMTEAYENMEFKEEVIFTGRVSDEALCNYLGSATALTYVSYFEGFGIPLLEAMSCDVPVLAANATSLPEVAGDAALLVDHDKPESIAKGMKQLAEQPELRENLIEKGRQRRKVFNWDKTAKAVWESILKTTQ